MNRVVVFPAEDSDDNTLAIDEGDYLAIKEIWQKVGLWDYHRNRGIQTHENEERRVRHLKIRFAFLPLPNAISELKYITDLDLCGSKALAMLPLSIGRLKHLKNLNLSDTYGSKKLPDEIGDLLNLHKLDLTRSCVASLPSSIGRLTNLKELLVDDNKNISELPNEIGNLSNLTILSLSRAKISSLPNTIGRLLNLTSLILYGTSELRELPEEIGHLSNLKVLDLGDTAFTRMPDSFARLSGLMYLDLYGTPREKKLCGNQLNKFLLKLVYQHSFLGCLGNKLEGWPPELRFALAHNRARFRLRVRASGSEWNEWMPLLWPRLIQRAAAAFEIYSQPYRDWDPWSEPFRIEKPDAIYEILVNDLLESFLMVLIHRRASQ